jgi:hypothetical protein
MFSQTQDATARYSSYSNTFYSISHILNAEKGIFSSPTRNGRIQQDGCLIKETELTHWVVMTNMLDIAVHFNQDRVYALTLSETLPSKSVELEVVVSELSGGRETTISNGGEGIGRTGEFELSSRIFNLSTALAILSSS